MSSSRFALGFAVYHAHDPSRDPSPFAALLERPLGEVTLGSLLTRVRKAKVDSSKFGAAQRFRREALLAEVAAGEVDALVVSSPTRPCGSSAAFLAFDTAPERALGDEARARVCPWMVKATFDCEALPADGVEEGLVAAFLAFAQAVGAPSGVVVVAGSVDDAYTASTGAGIESSTLADEEKERARRARRERDDLGQVARAPEWGTLLSAEHLRELGGDVWLGRQDCARVVRLAHGAVFLQLTLRGAEMASSEARARRARLEEAMGPVLTTSRG